MANDFFNHSANTVPSGTKARADHVNNIAQEIAAGLDKLPTEQELKQGGLNYKVDTGAADAYVLALKYLPTLTDGLAITFKAANSNTGPSTVDLNALGAKSLKHADGSELAVNDIVTGQIVSARYNGTEFRITSNTPNLTTSAFAAKTGAETAQTASEAAQALSEIAQALSETAQTASETAQTASETAQTASETAALDSAGSAASSSNSANTATTKAAEAAASALAALGSSPVKINGSSIVVTVGSGGDYATLNLALNDLADKYEEASPADIVQINILSGHVIDDQIVLNNKNYGFIEIVSEDQSVLVRLNNKLYLTGLDAYLFNCFNSVLPKFTNSNRVYWQIDDANIGFSYIKNCISYGFNAHIETVQNTIIFVALNSQMLGFNGCLINSLNQVANCAARVLINNCAIDIYIQIHNPNNNNIVIQTCVLNRSYFLLINPSGTGSISIYDSTGVIGDLSCSDGGGTSAFKRIRIDRSNLQIRKLENTAKTTANNRMEIYASTIHIADVYGVVENSVAAIGGKFDILVSNSYISTGSLYVSPAPTVSVNKNTLQSGGIYIGD